jgi:hypothetical protein
VAVQRFAACPAAHAARGKAEHDFDRIGLGVRHRVDHEVDAGDRRRHRFRAVEIHEGGAAATVTAAHAPDDAPARVLEGPHDSSQGLPAHQSRCSGSTVMCPATMTTGALLLPESWCTGSSTVTAHERTQPP